MKLLIDNIKNNKKRPIINKLVFLTLVYTSYINYLQ